jgi:hypothetical protein
MHNKLMKLAGRRSTREAVGCGVACSEQVALAAPAAYPMKR